MQSYRSKVRQRAAAGIGLLVAAAVVAVASAADSERCKAVG